MDHVRLEIFNLHATSVAIIKYIRDALSGVQTN